MIVNFQPEQYFSLTLNQPAVLLHDPTTNKPSQTNRPFVLHVILSNFVSNGVKLRRKKSKMPLSLNTMQKFDIPLMPPTSATEKKIYKGRKFHIEQHCIFFLQKYTSKCFSYKNIKQFKQQGIADFVLCCQQQDIRYKFLQHPNTRTMRELFMDSEATYI